VTELLDEGLSNPGDAESLRHVLTDFAERHGIPL
jgi:hypothetical protein